MKQVPNLDNVANLLAKFQWQDGVRQYRITVFGARVIRHGKDRSIYVAHKDFRGHFTKYHLDHNRGLISWDANKWRRRIAAFARQEGLNRITAVRIEFSTTSAYRTIYVAEDNGATGRISVIKRIDNPMQVGTKTFVAAVPTHVVEPLSTGSVIARCTKWDYSNAGQTVKMRPIKAES